MANSELTFDQKEELTQKLQPYIQKLEHLEQKHEKKDVELVVLKHAYENLQKQLDEVRDGIKKQKSNLTRSKACQGPKLHHGVRKGTPKAEAT